MVDSASRLWATSSRCNWAAALAPALRSVMAPISTPVRCATSPASRTMGCNLSIKRFTAPAISPISSLLSRPTRLVRSPSPAARSFNAAIISSNLLTTRRPSTTASNSKTPSPTIASPMPMRQRKVSAASRTVTAVLACICAAAAWADSRRAPSAAELSFAAPCRLSSTKCSLLTISCAKRLSRAARSFSTEAVETPINTLPISTPLGLMEASR